MGKRSKKDKSKSVIMENDYLEADSRKEHEKYVDLRIIDDFIKRVFDKEIANIVLKWSLKDKLGTCGIISKLVKDNETMSEAEKAKTLVIGSSCHVVAELLGADMEYIDKRIHVLIERFTVVDGRRRTGSYG